ncbi:hypothetical protein NQZ68_031545 [Dissostichus eleginoides]|nr:hypothetical protein NQZ68_031545 [Dissostichus eleginoides]
MKLNHRAVIHEGEAYVQDKRAVGLLRHYQANLTNPEEQALKTSVGKVSSILGSQLFHALLGS